MNNYRLFPMAFTFGRALGLASEELEHGSQLFVYDVAVFDRTLSDEELGSILFAEHPMSSN